MLATPSWGNVWVLVHKETAVSRLHQSLSFLRWDSWLGEASLDHASDLATHLLTVCFTVCVGWRSTFPLSLLFVVVLNVSQLTAGSRFLVSLRWCAWPSRVWRTGWLLFNYHRRRHATERSRRVPWASVAPHVITVCCVYVKSTVPDMWSTGNCENVVPVLPRWGRGSTQAKFYYVGALISEVGTTRQRGMAL